MRERRPRRDAAIAVNGITPARAGKTNPTCLFRDAFQDHPRSCGKDIVYLIRKEPGPGSPPLVRERRTAISESSWRLGITPARAGKTRLMAVGNSGRRDHPRSCGKDFYSIPARLLRWGSPPLVRERRTAYKTGMSIPGITPARAGKTPKSAL